MKGLLRSLSRGKKALAGAVKETIRINHSITVAGASGVGFGSVALAGLPQGNILLLGLVISSLQFNSASASITTTWDGDVSLGTTPASDGTLTGADVDLAISTAIGAATARLSPVLRIPTAAQSIIDNTDGSAEINLNLLVDDASISANGVVVTATGVLSILYAVLGDD